jgi:TrmH family RNA methyltransferase
MRSAVVATREVISSPANPLIKSVRRAVVQGSLTPEGFAVAESFHLLEEALRSDIPVHTVLTSETVRHAVERHIRSLRTVEMRVVADRLFDEIASTSNSQGVMALVKLPVWKLENVFRGHSLVVVLDGLQDPGNAGAIVRSAEAFGSTGVIFVTGTASPYNPKTLRASAGSLFRLPFVHGVDVEMARTALRQRNLAVFAGAPKAKMLVSEGDMSAPCALVVGSEAHGISEKMRAVAKNLRIATTGVESLNAAAAAAVILYEASRQRARKVESGPGMR